MARGGFGGGHVFVLGCVCVKVSFAEVFVMHRIELVSVV